MKKVWTIILIALLVIVLGVLVFVRFRPAKNADSDSLYPYSVQTTKKGLQVTVTGKFPDGCNWTGESRAKYVAGVSEKMQNKNRASFLITPISRGDSHVVLSLQKTAGGVTERVYEFDLDVSVGTDRTVTILNMSCREPDCIAGETENYAYHIVSAADGSLDLYAGSTSVYGWDLQIDGSFAAGQELTAQPNTDDIAHFRLTPLESGSGIARLFSAAAGEAVEIEVETDGEGRLHPGTHQVAAYEYVKPDAAAECAEAYEALMGAPVLPPDAELISANAVLRASRADADKYLDVGYLEFTMDGKIWELYGSDTATAADLFIDRSANAISQQTVKADGKTAIVYDHADGAFAGWKGSDGRNWLLQSEKASTEEVAAAVEKLLKVTA